MQKKANNKEICALVVLLKDCNNSCLFCSNKRFKDIPNNLIFMNKALKNAREKKADNVNFTGGEPTIHPNIFDVAKYAKDIGFKWVSINTNGRMLSYPNFCRQLIKSGVNQIDVSTICSKKDIHDSLTQSSGSFNQTIKGIRNVVATREYKKGKISLGISIVLCKSNYKDIKKICRDYADLGASSFRIKVVQGFGSGIKEFKRHSVKLSMYKKYLVDALEFCIKKDIDIKVKNYPICLMKEYHSILKKPKNNFFLFYVKNSDLMISDKNPFEEGVYSGKCKCCKQKNACWKISKGYYEAYKDQELDALMG